MIQCFALSSHIFHYVFWIVEWIARFLRVRRALWRQRYDWNVLIVFAGLASVNTNLTYIQVILYLRRLKDLHFQFNIEFRTTKRKKSMYTIKLMWHLTCCIIVILTESFISPSFRCEDYWTGRYQPHFRSLFKQPLFILQQFIIGLLYGGSQPQLILPRQ